MNKFNLKILFYFWTGTTLLQLLQNQLKPSQYPTARLHKAVMAKHSLQPSVSLTNSSPNPSSLGSVDGVSVFGSYPQLVCMYLMKGKKGEDSEARSTLRACPCGCPWGCRQALGAGRCWLLVLPSTGHQAWLREALSVLAAGPHTLYIPAESRWPNYVFKQTQLIYQMYWVLLLAAP